MKCATHPDAEATGFCRNCGKPLCAECTREVRGALYCEGCLATMLGGSTAAAAPTKSEQNPGLAAVLGFIPGLGAVYNGEYVKALIHVLVFGGLIAILSADLSSGLYALFGIALGAFYFYMPIEAYRVAKARRDGEPEPASLVMPQSNKPIGAYVLIALGVLFLLSNFGLLEKEWINKGWPIALIALGVWLLYNRVGRKA
jgi:TM2 domain-containing membrane protein YozV